ncbi:hypothetical protein [Arthrobacter sp. DR-2P]|nr:hypothetical protein [Arthrobacter sp. DR-2P]
MTTRQSLDLYPGHAITTSARFLTAPPKGGRLIAPVRPAATEAACAGHQPSRCQAAGHSLSGACEPCQE